GSGRSETGGEAEDADFRPQSLRSPGRDREARQAPPPGRPRAARNAREGSGSHGRPVRPRGNRSDAKLRREAVAEELSQRREGILVTYTAPDVRVRRMLLGLLGIGLLVAPVSSQPDRITIPAVASIVGFSPFFSDVRVFNTSYVSAVEITATYRCFLGSCP